MSTHTLTIAASESLSGASQNLGEFRILGILMPASWTAADLTFQGSADGTTYGDLYDDVGNEVGVDAAASRLISLTGAKFDALQACSFVKVRSGPTGAGVAQGGDRSLVLLLEPR